MKELKSDKEAPPPKAKLSYNEKREYEQIEGKILKIEREVESLNRSLEDPEIAENPQALQMRCSEIALAETQIEQLYLRWEELERKHNS